MRGCHSSWLPGLLLALSALAHGAGPEAGDAQVRAAFVFNFVRYVDWPDDLAGASAPLVVCYAGNRAATAQALGVMEGRLVRGRQVRLRQVDGDPAGCHVLVFGEGQGTPALLHRAQGRPILTVGEGWAFLDEGGIIALAVVDGKMAFGANLEAARRASLRLGSQMLKLARRIVDDPAK